MTTSHADATRIATEYLKTQPRRQEDRIGKVIAYSDSPSLRLGYMPLTGAELQDSWVAYVEPQCVTMLESSTIIVICRTTGKVLHFGKASDEG